MKTTLKEKESGRHVLTAYRNSFFTIKGDDVLRPIDALYVTLSEIDECDLNDVESLCVDSVHLTAEIEEYNWELHCGITEIRKEYGNCISVVLACKRCTKLNPELDCKQL